MGLLDNFGSKVGTYLGDKENLLNLASGFASMSGNPNTASIMAGIQGQRESLMKRRDAKAAQDLATSKATGQRNKTAEMLIAKGGKYAEIGNQLQNGSITFKQAIDDYQTLSKFNLEQSVKEPSVTYSQLPINEVMRRGLDPSIPYQISSDGKVTSVNSGSGVNITNTNAAPSDDQLAGTADEEQFKIIGQGSGKSVNALADSYETARSSLKQIDLLSQVGSIMDNSSALPPSILNMLPEGWGSSPLDAYRAVANGVAQGMYVPGSGTQTENDFRVLLSRAGSAGMTTDARILIQKGLRAATQRKMDLAAAAQAYQINANSDTRKVYQEKVKEIQDRPLFSAEERDLLESFGPKFDFSSLPQTHQTYASQLSDKNAKAFLTMSKAMQDKLYAAYLKSKVN
jgi:hypothetical protein|tara:strand:+ start:355 stop:1554 length:1200 start_codon:yes stop_codon:yes gene_type:complete